MKLKPVHVDEVLQFPALPHPLYTEDGLLLLSPNTSLQDPYVRRRLAELRTVYVPCDEDDPATRDSAAPPPAAAAAAAVAAARTPEPSRPGMPGDEFMKMARNNNIRARYILDGVNIGRREPAFRRTETSVRSGPGRRLYLAAARPGSGGHTPESGHRPQTLAAAI